jgi:hypothetical protein
MLAGQPHCKVWRASHRRGAYRLAANATTKMFLCMGTAQALIPNLRTLESVALQRICCLPLAGAAGSVAHVRRKGCEMSLRRAEDDRRMKMIANSELVRPLSTASDQRVWLMGMPRNYTGRKALFTLLSHAGGIEHASKWPTSWAQFDAGWRAVLRGAQQITCSTWMRESGPKILRRKASHVSVTEDLAHKLLARASDMERPWAVREVFAPLFDTMWMICLDDTEAAHGARATPPLRLADVPVQRKRGRHEHNAPSRDNGFTVSAAIVRAEVWPWTRDSEGIWALIAAAEYLDSVWMAAGWNVSDPVEHQRRVRDRTVQAARAGMS